MPAYLKSVTFDCADALVMARFRAAAVGSDVVVREGDELTVMRDPKAMSFAWSNISVAILQ